MRVLFVRSCGVLLQLKEHLYKYARVARARLFTKMVTVPKCRQTCLWFYKVHVTNDDLYQKRDVHFVRVILHRLA